MPKNEWKNIDILLVTHRHSNHCHVPAIEKLAKTSKFYSTKEVANNTGLEAIKLQILRNWRNY